MVGAIVVFHAFCFTVVMQLVWVCMSVAIFRKDELFLADDVTREGLRNGVTWLDSYMLITIVTRLS